MGSLTMKARRALLELLEQYSVSHVFGLVGETTLPLYDEWLDFEGVRNVMCRDERNAVFMADGYARSSFRPGVCEGPSPGAAYMLPGLTEAYASRIPLLVFTSDISLEHEYRNVLTSYDKSLMFRGVTKESITVYSASELPRLVRRAFRLATAGVPGPVHVRIPANIWDHETPEEEVYAQKEYSRYPALRFLCRDEEISAALRLLLEASAPVMVCGQGVLLSQAWDEVVKLAELLGIPVGTTITGKGAFPETHPLSIGVVGSRGGTAFSNSVVEQSDVIFYVGTNVDSTATDDWSFPSNVRDKKIIHLAISEAEIGNVYNPTISLLGDAKSILERMLTMISKPRSSLAESVIRKLGELRSNYVSQLEATRRDLKGYIDPYLFIKALEKANSEEHTIVSDPGVGAIYTSAYYKSKTAGRRFIFNYSVGGLGYAVPAAIGAYFGSGRKVIALTSDGSTGFNVGEWETIKRVGAKVKIVLFNNGSFGWIRAAQLEAYGKRFFKTDFTEVDYVKIAEGMGLQAERLDSQEHLEQKLSNFIAQDEPSLLEVLCLPEDQLLPPVPAWVKTAQKHNIPHFF